MITDGEGASAGKGTYPKKCVCPKDSATDGGYWMKITDTNIFYVCSFSFCPIL
jgi:hypothetical protein